MTITLLLTIVILITVVFGLIATAMEGVLNNKVVLGVLTIALVCIEGIALIVAMN